MAIHATVEPVILSIETCTAAGSLAVLRGEMVLSARSGLAGVASFSGALLSNIDATLHEAGIPATGISAFVAANGPGSFTGLRVGLATVKGFAATLDRPCIGISILHSIAHAAGPSRRTIATLPAGRRGIYAQELSVLCDGTVKELDSARLVNGADLVSSLAGQPGIVWAGTGDHLPCETVEAAAARHGIRIMDVPGSGECRIDDASFWSIAPAPDVLAVSQGVLALSGLRGGAAVRAEELRAFYPGESHTGTAL